MAIRLCAKKRNCSKSCANETIGRKINFDVVDIGHPSCNRIGYSFACNNNAYDLWWDPEIINKLYDKFDGIGLDRGNPKKAVQAAAWHVLKHPSILAPGIPFLARHLWRMKWDLLRSRFRVHKLSFMIHNFMHADCLDPERLNNCSFMVMTPDGPMSMCLHNAYRDHYITKEFQVNVNGQKQVFNPVRPHKRDYWEKRKAELHQIGRLEAPASKKAHTV